MFYENRSERLAWRVSLGFLLRSGWMTLVMSHPPDGPRCRNLPRGQEVDQAGCAICPPHPPPLMGVMETGLRANRGASLWGCGFPAWIVWGRRGSRKNQGL